MHNNGRWTHDECQCPNNFPSKTDKLIIWRERWKIRGDLYCLQLYSMQWGHVSRQMPWAFAYTLSKVWSLEKVKKKNMLSSGWSQKLFPITSWNWPRHSEVFLKKTKLFIGHFSNQPSSANGQEINLFFLEIPYCAEQ